MVRYEGNIYKGIDGARILLERQAESIRRLKEKNIIVKIKDVYKRQVWTDWGGKDVVYPGYRHGYSTYCRSFVCRSFACVVYVACYILAIGYYRCIHAVSRPIVAWNTPQGKA